MCKQFYVLDIKRKPVGERILPLPYVKLYYDKKENITWQRMYELVNEDYLAKQQKQIQKHQARELKRQAIQKQRKRREDEARMS